MAAYVNHKSLVELIEPVFDEGNLVQQAAMARDLRVAVENSLFDLYAQVCYDLKVVEDWNTGQISMELGISERKVKSLIAWFARKNNADNPLNPREPRSTNVVDISLLVRKARKESTPPDRQEVAIPKTLVQVFDEENDLAEQANHS